MLFPAGGALQANPLNLKQRPDTTSLFKIG
jgi:hypothetical protein